MWAVSCCYLIGIVLRTEEPFLNADTWEEVSTNISFSHFYKALVITVKVVNINR